MRFQDHVLLLTGAAQGIGAATAHRFAAEGARLALFDTQTEPLERLADACREQHGAEVLAYTGSVTRRADWDALVAALLARWGRLDVLIHNAGITRDARLAQMTPEQFDTVLDVNLRALFHGTQACLSALVQARGCIVSASSVVGISGNYGQTNYAAAKAGVIGMTKTWARELGPLGVRVNAVAPGFIATPMTAAVPDKVIERMTAAVPLQRLGQPEDIAAAYAFLASRDAAFIHGTVLEVTGGMAL